MLFSSRNRRKRQPMISIRAVERLEDRQLLTGIAVTVLPGTDLASSTVDVSGFERHRITASENSQMGLTAGEWSGTLNDSVAAYLGGAYPKWATVANWSSSCNICGNYATYGWTEVHTTVQPVSAEIVSFDLEQVQGASQTHRNPTGEEQSSTLEVSYTETDTTSHSWSQSQSIEVSQSISYEVGGVGGETGVSYTSEWGTEQGTEVSFERSATAGASVVVPPFDALESYVSVSKGELVVDVTYEATFDGCVSTDFPTAISIDGSGFSHYWCFDINSVLSAGGFPTTQTITERITVPFFTNSEIVTRYLNNTFTEARQIQPGDTVHLDSGYATVETGEPQHAGVNSGASVWYKWTAREDGPARINTEGADFDTVLGVYTGTAVDNLVEVTSNDDADSANGIRWSNVTFEAQAGTTYRIAVAGIDGQTGETDLNLVFPYFEAPANDDFADSTTLVPGEVAVTDARGASRQGGEPLHAASSNPSTVWYNWTAPSGGPAHLTTGGSDFDTVLAVYTGNSMGSLSSVASNNDVEPNIQRSEVTFEAQAGTTYRIAVAGNGDESGIVNLTLSHTPVVIGPTNDDFANSLALVPGVLAQIETTGATRETGEPLHAGNEGSSTVWYSWTAPETGEATLTTSGSEFDTTLGVYTGSNVASLTEVASNDDEAYPDILTSRLTFVAQAGTTYRIALSGYDSAAGDASLLLSFAPTPPAIPGDSNHDGRFDSSDLVMVFTAGEYEDGIAGNSTFEEGDWNGDGDFDTSDLVYAFTAGTYQATAVAGQVNRIAANDRVIRDLFSDDRRVKRNLELDQVDDVFADELLLA